MRNKLKMRNYHSIIIMESAIVASDKGSTTLLVRICSLKGNICPIFIISTDIKLLKV